MTSEESSDPRSLFYIYFETKVLHVREFLIRIFYAFFMPHRLASQIKLEDFHSFKHAIDDVLIAFSIFAISDPILSFFVGAELMNLKSPRLLER